MSQKSSFYLSIFAVVLSSSLVGSLLGYFIPFQALRLNNAGGNIELIGLMSSAPALGMFISSLITPQINHRFPIKITMTACLLFILVTLNLSLLQSDPKIVFFFSLVMGMCCGVIVILGETWVAERSPDTHKGRFIGFYTTCYTGSQLCGPLFISFFGFNDLIPRSIISSLLIISSLFIVISSIMLTSRKTIRLRSSFSLLKITPALFMAVFCFSFFDSTVLSLFPIYTVNNGHPESSAAFLITLIFVGDALLQIPIGWLSDKFGSKNIHRLCGITSLILILFIPYTVSTSFIWIHMILLGGVAGGIYTLALIRASEIFSGSKLILTNSLFGVLWGIGSTSGPIVSGTLMKVFSHDGFLLSLSMTTVVFLAFTFNKTYFIKLGKSN
ncbi:MFS transporter [Photobacterium sp. TLY01]|uniref:MFS transporter n=1 Tax=Photobacterium sp. TLY01 TaxID=2907534 RepID=UPI001F30E3EC|nr:MFS transporter [Photobacterium sp. TLY01]UIP29017.1 MFS transporter [Photobacterium sp. TLY01]